MTQYERRAAGYVELIHIMSARAWLARRYKRASAMDLTATVGWLRIRAFEWYGVHGC